MVTALQKMGMIVKSLYEEILPQTQNICAKGGNMSAQSSSSGLGDAVQSEKLFKEVGDQFLRARANKLI